MKFLCLNLRDSKRTLIESMGIEVLCPEQQWEAEGGLWNEITAGQNVVQRLHGIVSTKPEKQFNGPMLFT